MSEQVLEAVRDLVPAIAERVGEAEEARRVPESTMKELTGAGFFRLLQPKAFGGHEADPAVFYTAVREVSAACGSTGWVASVVGVHPWQLALFPVRAQEEVWGADPNMRISSSYAPTGKMTPVDGGFRVSGRWSFSSGCDHAGWVFLGGLIFGDDGEPVDMRTFLLPRADYRIDDVWDTIGLRGTGSNDIVVEDAFVPEHRTLSFDLLFENAGGRALKAGHAVQRGWRDAHAGRVHAVNDPERALTLYGQGALGFEVTDTML